jgi:citrate/tricarballylate utilization protein
MSDADANGAGHRSALTAEVDRLLVICNACRYCEGLCAVFPAMERRRVFADADVDFLANLCHNCGACLFDCQYAPPHQFDVVVPATLARVRTENWERYAWPSPLGRLFRVSAPATVVAVAASLVVFLVAVGAANGTLIERHTGEGAFYEVVPHDTIVGLYLAGAAFAVVAVWLSVRRWWRATGGGRPTLADLTRAGRSASTLENLDGGGPGCMNADDAPDDNRRVYHHLTYYGFALCLAATTLAAILEGAFDQVAPYAPWHPVVVLGTVGGIGLLVGPAGLLAAKRHRHDDLTDPDARPMELAFLGLLMALSVTGLAALVLRSTALMPLLLVVHLAVVFAFFVTLPYTKFVHGAYRYAALVRDAGERRRADGA